MIAVALVCFCFDVGDCLNMSEEVKTKAICVRAIDYGESDRLITLLTSELGKITVRARGVLSAKAKLRHAAQPFAFGDYILTEKSGFYTLSGFDYVDGFTSLSDDLLRYYLGVVGLEVAEKLTEEGSSVRNEFACLVRYLTNLAYDGGNNKVELIRYIINMLRIVGYGVSTDPCIVCGADVKSYVFDLDAGGFVCDRHKGRFFVRLSEETGMALKLINSEKSEENINVAPEIAADIISLFSQYIKFKTAKTVKSAFETAELLRILK